MLLIYVDDIIVTGNDNNIISDLISTMSSDFSLKDLGSLHYFLGLEVKYLPNGLFVSQTKYTRDLLEHTKMMECTHINTPVDLKSIITLFDEQPIRKIFNLQSQKIMQRSLVLERKFTTQGADEVTNYVVIIACDYNIINIDK